MLTNMFASDIEDQINHYWTLIDPITMNFKF